MNLLLKINNVFSRVKDLPSGREQYNEVKSIAEEIKNSFFLEDYKGDKNWNHMVGALRNFAQYDAKAVRDGLKYKFPDIPVNFKDYKSEIEGKIGKSGQEIIEGFIEYASKLKASGKHKIAIINATFYGGGVAEMLLTAGPILAEHGIELEWHIIYPHSFEFYHITKTIHNAIQGKDEVLTQEQLALWEKANSLNYDILQDLFLDQSIARFFIEDPQVAPLVGLIKQEHPNFPLSWRLHIDISGIGKKNTGAIKIWNAIKANLNKMNGSDMLLFQPGHIPEDLPISVPCFSQYPGIDPLKPKNFLLSKKQVLKSLNKINKFCKTSIDIDKKYIVTGARFDYWKGLTSVLRSFESIAHSIEDINLIVFGGYANDDPEGLAYFETLKFMVDNSPYKERIELVFNQTGQEIGALYRLAGLHNLPYCAVSLAEGYCLMTDEASVQGAVPFTSEVGGLGRYPDGEWRVNILDIANKIEDASSLYQVNKNKLLVDSSAEKIEKRITQKFLDLLNLRKSDIASYNKLYSSQKNLSFEMTYKYSLISMLLNYLVLAEADSSKLSAYSNGIHPSVDVLR
jgi:trehalose synthase